MLIWPAYPVECPLVQNMTIMNVMTDMMLWSKQMIFKVFYTVIIMYLTINQLIMRTKTVFYNHQWNLIAVSYTHLDVYKRQI